MQKILTNLLLLILLLSAGCRKSEIVISEDPEEEVFLVDEQLPKDIYLFNQSDPNNIFHYVPDNKVSPHDLYSLYNYRFEIIKPDTSKDYTMIIIPSDPNCDPGIFVGGMPQTKPKQNLQKK